MPGFLSKYRSSSASVGSFQLMADGPDVVSLLDGSHWLRAGAFAVAASYPGAATLEHMKAYAVSRQASSFAPGLMAHDGNGIIVWVPTGTPEANVQVSTDHGATWSLVAHGMSINPSFVAFLNGKFWLVGNDASSIYAAESVTGATGTWTQRAVYAGGGGQMTANTGMIDWTGTNYVVVATSSASTSNVHTSSNGTAWTPRNLSEPPTSTACMAAAATTGRVLCVSGSSNAVATYSSDHGVTWADVSISGLSGAGQRIFTVGDRFFLWAGGTTGLWTTTDPSAVSNWTRVNVPSAALAAAGASILTLSALAGFRSHDRAHFYTHAAGSGSPGLALRADSAGTLTIRHTSLPVIATSPCYCAFTDQAAVFVADSSAAYRASGSWAAPNAVAAGSRALRAASNYEANVYARIK